MCFVSGDEQPANDPAVEQPTDQSEDLESSGEAADEARDARGLEPLWPGLWL
jgi:hypothetical protein